LEKLLVLGSGGNLGKTFLKQPFLREFEIIDTSLESFLINKKAKIELWNSIQVPRGFVPDIIINLTNKYYPRPTSTQIVEMRDSILGIGNAILKSNLKWNAKIIQFSSYFQYAPRELSPWSEYSDVKNELIKLLNKDNYLVEIVLYDNYGGSRKDKFLDLVINASKNNSKVDANPGESLLNLTHIDDICLGLDLVLSNSKSMAFDNTKKIQLKSSQTLTLREVVSIINTISGNKVNISWGALEYRAKEVFAMWESAPNLLGWSPKRSLEEYIKEELNNNTN
jgi:hypothetical protein